MLASGLKSKDRVCKGGGGCGVMGLGSWDFESGALGSGRRKAHEALSDLSFFGNANKDRLKTV